MAKQAVKKKVRKLPDTLFLEMVELQNDAISFRLSTKQESKTKRRKKRKKDSDVPLYIIASIPVGSRMFNIFTPFRDLLDPRRIRGYAKVFNAYESRFLSELRDEGFFTIKLSK